MRDTLAARGPDDAGFWSDGQVHIGHRRLAINSPAANRQPWAIASPHELTLAFNGELYECDELRATLERLGHAFTLGSDTELLAHAIAEWGAEAPKRLRGMFAYVAWIPSRQELLVARDALGVVPLYVAQLPGEVVIASEPRALLAHPSIAITPDWTTVAWYLNCLRTTRGRHTMFAGIECIQPGESLIIRLDRDQPEVARGAWWRAPAEDASLDSATACGLVRETLERSVAAHLVSDVPLCSLLSGGIDSTIIAALARRGHSGLRTFCAGTPSAPGQRGDIEVAEAVAAAIGTHHTGVPIEMARFHRSWAEMVTQLGVPLSTPNEVAIRAVAEALRPHAKVALSGEGADELFAGYGPPLSEAEAWIERARAGAAQPVEVWQANTFGWVAPSMLESALAPNVYAATGGELACLAFMRAEIERCGDPLRLRTHLDLQRSLNLTALLQRLNTATMLASVEGRVPFADVEVASLAARIPLELHYPSEESLQREASTGGTATLTLPRTKHLVRRAFADLVPHEALVRPKASFPLPFERWLDGAEEARAALRSSSAQAVIAPAALELIGSRPTEHWRVAWPLLNLAMWLARWWG